MNKKQLIVVWAMGILICLVFLVIAKEYVVLRNGSYVRMTPKSYGYDVAMGWIPQWGFVLPISLTILIIGGLLIYTLRDKKK